MQLQRRQRQQQLLEEVCFHLFIFLFKINFTLCLATTTTTTPQPTTEITTEILTSTTDYPTFYQVNDPYAGEPQANQPFPEVIYSRSNLIFNDFLTILFSFILILNVR